MSPRQFSSVSAALLAASFTSIAQDQPKIPDLIRRAPAARQEPQSPLLTFNIVALDPKGGSAGELHESDLRIYDDGKLMHPVFCRPLETAGPSTPLGSGEYSNRPIRGESQTVLVLLDLLNENFAERGLAWNDIAHAFQKVDARDRVFVYLVTAEGVLYPVHPMPAAGNTTPPDADWASKVPALLDRAIHNVYGLKPQEYRVNVDARVRRSLDLLKDVATDLGAQPGRKSLVWVSHGFPISATSTVDNRFRDYTPAIRDLGSDLARSGIILYTVDQAQRSTDGVASSDTLRELAGFTGGVFLSTDQTLSAIQQAIAEAKATYRIGFIPPLDRWDNRFHRLRITVEGKNDRLRLRAPQGYFGDAREADPRDRFNMAAIGQADDSSIGIRAIVTPSEKVKGWLHFQVHVDPGDLQLTSGDPSTGEFGVTFAYFTNSWDPNVASEVQTTVSLTKANREAILRDGVELSFERPIPGDVRKIRIVVRDAHSGAVGSLAIPIAGPPQP